jgi:HlyD family secretion protein
VSSTTRVGFRIDLRSRALRIAGAVAVAALLAGVWLWTRGESGESQGYVTDAVDRGPIVVAVTATGTVNPVKTVQVGTYVSGTISEIYVDFNSPVTKNMRVAKIDPRPFHVKVLQAEASLANARAQIEKTRVDLGLKKLDFERNQTLREGNLIAQHDLDTSRSAYEQAQAQLRLDEAAAKQAQAALEEARINLGYTDITSPVDGVVVARNVDVGQTVAASFQTPTLFLIAEDLTKMQVDANVSESDIGGVHDGQPVQFSVDAFPGRTFEGTVVQVRNSPIVVQNVVTYDVVIQVANADLALKPGMTATVAITTARRDDAVRIPVRALRFRPARESGAAPEAAEEEPEGAKAAPSAAVWLPSAGDALRRVEVRTGLRNDRYAELLSGDVEPGQHVVVALRRATTTAAPKASPFQPRPR